VGGIGDWDLVAQRRGKRTCPLKRQCATSAVAGAGCAGKKRHRVYSNPGMGGTVGRGVVMGSWVSVEKMVPEIVVWGLEKRPFIKLLLEATLDGKEGKWGP